MALNYSIDALSPHLFWDVDRDLISWEKHPHFLVERVLEFGVDQDWQILKEVYGISKTARIATELRTLDEVALNFIATLSNTPLEKFRCYIRSQSIPHYSGY
jgi:hypothetical protein